MVCDRCKAAVQQVFVARGLPITQLELGKVVVPEVLDDTTLAALENELERAGFGLVTNTESRTITRIKAAIVELVHGAHGDQRVKLSEHLPALLHYDYSGLSALFSQVEGITIEHFFLLQRIERVKELIQYGELTMSEIAFRTGFSSAAHLSNQFKKLTGMTPTAFRQVGGRRTLDRV